MSLFNSKLFCVEAKFSLVDLRPTRKYPREDVDIYVSRFHEREFYERATDYVIKLMKKSC